MWRERKIELTSSLPPDAATSKLRLGLSARRPFFPPLLGDDYFGYLVLGEIEGHKMRLYAVRKGVTHSWRATFRGEMVPDAVGSRLVGDIRYPRFAKVFTVIWFAPVVVGLLVGAVVTSVLFAQGHTDDAVSALGFTGFLAGFSLFGLLIMSIGYGLGRRDEAYLRDWLSRTLVWTEM